MAAKGQLGAVRASTTDVLVMAFGGKGFDGMSPQRMQIATMLRDCGVSTEYLLKEKPKLPAQFKEADRVGARIGVILGEDEWARGEVKVKVMGLAEDHPEKNGVDVKIDGVVDYVRGKLGWGREAAGSELEGLLSGTEKLSVAAES